MRGIGEMRGDVRKITMMRGGDVRGIEEIRGGGNVRGMWDDGRRGAQEEDRSRC